MSAGERLKPGRVSGEPAQVEESEEPARDRGKDPSVRRAAMAEWESSASIYPGSATRSQDPGELLTAVLGAGPLGPAPDEGSVGTRGISC